DEIHDVLRTSANTRMGTAWFGMIITYTRFEEGFAMRMYERAKENPQMYYADLAATWEVNPKFDRNADEVLEMYRHRPREAAARYECRPSSVLAAFFDFPEKIKAAVDPTRPPCAHVAYTLVERVTQDGKTLPYESVMVSEVVYVPGRVYFLGGDAGKTEDSYTLAVFSVDETDDAPDWWCPNCGQNEVLRQAANYTQIRDKTIQTTLLPNGVPDVVRCGLCGTTPVEFHPGLGIIGWWRRGGGEV